MELSELVKETTKRQRKTKADADDVQLVTRHDFASRSIMKFCPRSSGMIVLADR